MSDQLFKRRAKRDFSRPKNSRNLVPHVLIITEGEKTEPLYLGELCRYLGLNVEIDPIKNKNDICITGKSCGSDPKSISDYAKEKLKKKDEFWDEVYCVFDKDQHQTYRHAVEEIRKLQEKYKNKKIEAITSVICFELWFLLHYSESSKPYSRADDLIHDLKNINHKRKKPFDNYQKKQKDTFSLTKDLLDTAKRNANAINNCSSNSGTDNPSTKLPDLILRLEEISTI